MTRRPRGGLSVIDLRAKLKELGLPQTGTKAELIARYEQSGGVVPAAPVAASPRKAGKAAEEVAAVGTEAASTDDAGKRPAETLAAASPAKKPRRADEDLTDLDRIAEAPAEEAVYLAEEEAPAPEDDSNPRLVNAAAALPAWRKPAIRALVKNLVSIRKVEKSELPNSPDDLAPEQLLELKGRYDEAVEAPLSKFARHLKPALFRRIHVGTMDLMGHSHEHYRQAFDFLEITSTWNDTDKPTRKLSPLYTDTLKCGYQPVSRYEDLAERARDRFMMVVKVSCVATHLERLENFREWWPKLYQEKYSKLKSATVAFLWQFPPGFAYSYQNWEKLDKLSTYLGSEESGCPNARHIVDFRNGSWYRDNMYDFLREKRWCLAWLHLNNEKQWASDLPNGWTDRVRTTDFVFCRLFGPDGPTHGLYEKRFLHELFDACPMGTSTYVLFGNRELLEDPNPARIPAHENASEFRSIFTKMDFVGRVRDVRYKGECPRVLPLEEQLLINSFYLRFSKKARDKGVTMATPVCSQMARKYYETAPPAKRCFEWYFPGTGERLHLSLHDAKEDEDLWTPLRQLTGFEDINALKAWAKDACTRSCWSGKPQVMVRWQFDGHQEILGMDLVRGRDRGPVLVGAPCEAKYGKDTWLEVDVLQVEGYTKEETALVSSTFLRFSEAARNEGLLRSTRLTAVSPHGFFFFALSNDRSLQLDVADLDPEKDLWRFLADLSRVPLDQLAEPEKEEVADPWQDGWTWKKLAGEMWNRGKEQEEESAGDEWSKDHTYEDDKGKGEGKGKSKDGRSGRSGDAQNQGGGRSWPPGSGQKSWPPGSASRR